ncbi:MAG TPA: GerMN domain-containing protein [Bacillota bacterium]|jgi:spore germination protein GerM
MKSYLRQRVMGFAVVAAIVATLAAGCTGPSAKQAAELKARVDQLEKQVADLTAKNTQLQGTIDQLARPVTVYFVTSTPSEMYLSPVKRLVAKAGDPLVQAIQELIRGPEAGSNLTPVLPAETRVLGVKVKDGTAYVDFSQEVMKLNVGARGEALTLAAIADTLTEFPEVKQVQILVAGKAVESIGGHFSADRPITRNVTVVK